MTSSKQFMAVSVTGKYFITEIVIILLGLPENQISNKTGSGGIPKNNSYRLFIPCKVLGDFKACLKSRVSQKNLTVISLIDTNLHTVVVTQ